MKTDNSFLKALRKNLHFLSKQEKDNIISEYQTKIYERSQKGEDIKSIIGSFERPETIAQKVHNKELYSSDSRYNIKNANILKYNSKFNSNTLVLFQSLFSLFWIIVAIATIVLSIVAFVFIWLSFDPLVAVGPSLLILGVLALIGGFFWWISRKTLPIRKDQNFQDQKKAKKIFIISLISILSVFTISGIVGSFATTKTLGRVLINSAIDNKDKNNSIKYDGKFDHYKYSFLNQQKQTSIFKIDEIKSLDLTTLYSLTTYGLVVEVNPNNDSQTYISVEIVRDYNTKKNDITFDYKTENDKTVVNTNQTHLIDKWLKGNRFTIKVNINSSLINIDASNPSNLKFSTK